MKKVLEKKVRYITLPFLGHFSYHIRNSMSNLLSKQFANVNFTFIFTNRNTVSSLFRVKDPIPITLCSDVVYCFKCPDCMSRYIGSTSRNLKIRISEHKGISYRTNTQITRPSFSRIREHAQLCNHSINEENFSILFRANSMLDLRIAESLLIMKEKPELNDNEVATRLMILS